MTKKRAFAVFIAFVVGFNILMLRLVVIVSNRDYTDAAVQQSSRSYTVAAQRPDFLDYSGRPLVSTEYTQEYLIIPRANGSDAVFRSLDEAARQKYSEQFKGTTPFLIDSQYAKGLSLDSVSVRKRYVDDGLLSHTLGYLNAGGAVSGLELALDGYLGGNTLDTVVSYSVNAVGDVLEGTHPVVSSKGDNSGAVVLTIDKDIQQAAERVADEMLVKGAIVVVDCETGAIRALVSRPDFDPNDIEGSLASEDSSFLNRCLLGYSVGSVYKPVVAAAAIDSGVARGFAYECTGAIEVDGHVYTCNNGVAHGTMGISSALRESCNTFFIALGQKVGAEAVRNTSSALGFGAATEFCVGFKSSSGTLPTASELRAGGELCNHSFGQGKLLATPVQVAAYTNCLANGGLYRQLSLIVQVGDAEMPKNAETRAISEQAADYINGCLKAVVDSGTGVYGNPNFTTAAGKTGTAQSGRYNEDGKEILIGWFSGYFPADEPRYVITVMTEDAGYGYLSAAPVFKRLADDIVAMGK